MTRVYVAGLLLAVAGSITSIAGAADGAPAAAGRESSHVILVSIDGFRWDYRARFATPALDRLAARGVHAASLRPAYPTLTFPNHYSIATGLYPRDHGIVANDFPDDDRNAWYSYRNRETVQDGRWYGGVPVWVAAERAGLGSAAFFFVGSEAPVGGVAPAHWRPFDADVPGATRVDQVLEWLALPAGRRPGFVALYFEHVDNASHRYGPGSAEAARAIAAVDGWIGRLLDGIDRLGMGARTHVVVVSDHGQSRYRRDVPPLILGDVIDLDGIDIMGTGAFAYLYLPDGAPERAASIRDAINRAWAHGRAYLPADAPGQWRVTGSPRIGDVIVQSDPGFGVIATREQSHRLTTGDHGWAPEFRDMHGFFVAGGPRLPAGRELDTLDVVDIYPLLLELLGLPDSRSGAPESPLCRILVARAACR